MKKSYEKSFAMIKPGSFKDVYQIKDMILKSAKKIKILDYFNVVVTKAEMEKLYEVHKERSFFNSMCDSYDNQQVHFLKLGGMDVIKKVRDLLGATNPKEAEPGTLRARFGVDIDNNVMHGSDSLENAQRELAFFDLIKAKKNVNPYAKKHTPKKTALRDKNPFAESLGWI
jgi:nucleoside-diphosphate kinase